MLARERRITLASGRSFQTPLLVPSISSAGFDRVAAEGGGTEPESARWLSLLRTEFETALLVSAYDIAHANLPEHEELLESFAETMYATPEVLIIDSGLYELVHGPPPHSGPRLAWDRRAYENLASRLDRSCGAILVNYDGYDGDGHTPFASQITAAREFFGEHVELGSDLLIKPEERPGYLDVESLAAAVSGLEHCDIIGVTEKDLGQSLLAKLTALATLRVLLDESGIDAPIHLFGSLDPVLSPLYHAAGAEIFDGLTWLRYGYFWDATIYYGDIPVLEDEQLSASEPLRKMATLIGNLRTLRALSDRMRQFAGNGEWSVFGPRIGDRLFDAHRALTASMGE